MLIHNTVVPQLVAMDYPHIARLAGKPNGLWYGINTSWHDWCETEMPDFLGPYNHRIRVDYSKILRIGCSAELVAFDQKYRAPGTNTYALEGIDWLRVREDYSGIEISPYQWEHRLSMMWYYGWDVASGCVWDWNAILSVEEAPMEKLVAELEELELDADGNF